MASKAALQSAGRRGCVSKLRDHRIDALGPLGRLELGTGAVPRRAAPRRRRTGGRPAGAVGGRPPARAMTSGCPRWRSARPSG
ncbi:MAG: hypothetical protein MZV63_34225 [Marinilabiliales bacterium]|nr:hypothetical protein [Marinilabiliales bacterium]